MSTKTERSLSGRLSRVTFRSRAGSSLPLVPEVLTTHLVCCSRDRDVGEGSDLTPRTASLNVISAMLLSIAAALLAFFAIAERAPKQSDRSSKRLAGPAWMTRA